VNESEAPEYLPLRAVSERWQVDERTVRRLVARGELPAVRFGPKTLRVRCSDVLAFEAEKAVCA
jgi:excisionase family DNA binding protein